MSNSNNRMIVFASIIVAILATSILALNPSTITNVGAQMYGDQYGYDRNYYQDDNRYGYDNNHPEKKNVNVQKIKCVNSNINVNGVDITKIPRDDIAGLAAANEAGEGPDAANTQNGNGLGDRINFDRNLVNVCANVNDNEQTEVSPPPPPPPEETATLNVTKTVACDDTRDSGLSAQQLDACRAVTTAIQESLFTIDVTDTDPTPTQFTGSEAGTLVTLGPGDYVVEETPNEAAIDAIIDGIESQDGFQITGLVTTFSGDCTQSGNFEATGSLSAGDSETCNIENTFSVGPPPPVETATLNVTKTVACQDIRGEPGISVQQNNLELCDVVTNVIPESLFTIDVTDTDPTPTQFTGSEAGTLVTLGPGDYVVEETPDAAAIDAIIDGIESQDGFQINGPLATFSGDCDQDGDFNATGSLSAGDSETCGIENKFFVGNEAGNCDECFETTNNGGPIPPGLLTKLNAYLANNDVTLAGRTGNVGNVTGLCAAIETLSQTTNPATSDDIRTILEDAWAGVGNAPPVINRVIECLLGLDPPVIEED